MKLFAIGIAIWMAATLLCVAPSIAAPSLAAKTSFGGGDGWLAPAEAAYLQGANVQRGLTYNPVNNHLYLVDRSSGDNVRVLNGTTGALLSSLDMTGVEGGTFAINMIDVDDSGVIYGASLCAVTEVSIFRVYRWATEGAAPTVAFDSTVTPISNSTDIRVGDAFAVIGSGASTLFVSGANLGTTAGDAGDNAFVVLNTADGLNYSAAVQDFTGTEPANGTFRLGIDFIDANTIIGRQVTASPFAGTVADFTGGTATVAALAELINGSETALAVDRVNKLLATLQYTTNDVRLYNIADPENPVLLDTKNLAVGAATANINGTGDLKFGNGALYVLNTNNGIQAYDVVSPNNGDYNGNGRVDAADYVVWRETVGQSVSHGAGADGDGNGSIDQLDYAHWRARFGNPVGSGSVTSAAIPEPTGLALILLAASMFALTGRRST